MSFTTAADPPFQHLARQARQAMEQLHKGYYGFYPSDTWTPSVNLYETAVAYLVCVDLAGVDKEKIDVEVNENRLRLRGTRVVPMKDDGGEETAEQDAKRVRVHLMEIDHGSFSREVELPENVDAEKIAAEYRNGMLWIEIPKA
ncbi:MAG TPA: Hsp20/alpha crystallin family protein [Tepidisphaeraceae bacterium]|jgi:HSP20 family protein|nr:Hsp20/alpha crystallin family protein [Tepidisphaeraceae bacterium]